MSEIFGFGGRKESGKTTAANMLREIADPLDYEHIEFSDAIIGITQHWLTRLRDNPDASPTQHREWLADILTESAVKIRGTGQHNTLPPEYIKKLHANSAPDIKKDKEEYRLLLEWLGATAITMASPGIWGNIVAEKIQTAKTNETGLITIGGVRTAADSETVRSPGGTLIRLHRQNDQPVALTEKQLGMWPADYDIDNNGTLEDLKNEVTRIWEKSRTDEESLEKP